MLCINHFPLQDFHNSVFIFISILLFTTVLFMGLFHLICTLNLLICREEEIKHITFSLCGIFGSVYLCRLQIVNRFNMKFTPMMQLCYMYAISQKNYTKLNIYIPIIKGKRDFIDRQTFYTQIFDVRVNIFKNFFTNQKRQIAACCRVQ